MVVEIIFINLTDIIYIVLSILGLLFVGAFYLLPKVVGEFHPAYDVIVDIVNSYSTATNEVEINPARIKAGEIIILIPKGTLIDENTEKILLDVGFPRGIVEGLCKSKGCSMRFIVNRREVIECLSSTSLNPFYTLSEEYLQRKKYVAFFNETGMKNAIEMCLKDRILVASDLVYKEGLLSYLPLYTTQKKDYVSMIFSNSSFQINFAIYKGMVRII